MKRLFFIVAVFSVISGAVSADEFVRKGKIGFYTDVEHAGWCADGTPYYFFDLYLYIQPDENGVRAVEFLVDYPDNVAAVETVLNEAFVTTSLGTPGTGMAIAYDRCLRDWHWPMRQRMIVLDAEPSRIRLDAYPAEIVPGLDVASCVEPSRPIYLLHRHADAYINQCAEAVWPAWLDSSTVDGPSNITLYFADKVSEEMAEDTADYSLVNRLDSTETLAVSAADVLADGRSVQLTTASPFMAGHLYILEISDDADSTKGANVLWTGAGLCPDFDIRAIYPPVGQDQDAARYPIQLIIRNNGGIDAGQFTIHLELKHRIKIGYHWYYRTLRTYERTVEGLSAGAAIAETFCTDLSGRGFQFIDFIASIEYPGPDEDCYLDNNELFLQDWPGSPLLESAADVANDEGGWIRLIFYKSGYKTDSETAAFYEIYMRQSGSGTDNCGCEPGLCGDWVLARTAPAEGVYSYGRWVETPCDLTPSAEDCVFDFIVAGVDVTETGDTLRHYSEIKSGYSIDNISPSIPQGLTAVQNGDDLFLSWWRSVEDDVVGYRLYRYNPSSGSTWNLIAEPVDTFYLDEDWYVDSGCMYRLSVVDQGGNESEAAQITPEDMIGTMLEQYSADFRGNAVRIEWKLNEIDPGITFFVLRARDGMTFEEISSLPAGDGTLDYVFEDNEIEFGEDYVYRIEFEAGGERRFLLETEQIEIPEMPLTLEQNVPNPFNPSTSISFYLPEATEVRIEVFDVSGRRIKTLKNERIAKGAHQIEWDGRDSNGSQAVSGVYFYRLIAGKERLSRKMILLR